jgi:hypothetical protein
VWTHGVVWKQRQRDKFLSLLVIISLSRIPFSFFLLHRVIPSPTTKLITLDLSVRLMWRLHVITSCLRLWNHTLRKKYFVLALRRAEFPLLYNHVSVLRQILQVKFQNNLGYFCLFQSKHSCFWCSLILVNIGQHVSTLLFPGHHQVSPFFFFFISGSSSGLSFFVFVENFSRVETCCPILTDIKEHQKQLCFAWKKPKLFSYYTHTAEMNQLKFPEQDCRHTLM